MVRYKRVRRVFRMCLFLLTLLLALPALAYDYPLTVGAIREAYFLGKRQASLGDRFLAEYTHAIPQLRVGAFFSEVRIETPFSQVAEYTSKKLEYSAQDAVADFSVKPAAFRMYLDICYKSDAPPNSVRIKIIQNKKELVPVSADRSPYYPKTDKRHHAPSIGERVQLVFRAEQLDSSALTILIDTLDDQHAEAQFDLQALR
jgi:hypothetical protein